METTEFDTVQGIVVDRLRLVPLGHLSILLCLLLHSVVACKVGEGKDHIQNGLPERLSVKILAEYPHDPGAFTQGLLWFEGKLYESTGNYGRSSLREVRLETGDVIRQMNLPPQFFGEGLAKVGRQLIQLTWREGVAIVYEFPSLRESRRIGYEGEGWGLSFDGSWLVMSDGSDVLTYREPRNMAVWKTLPVTLRGRPVRFLNELECVQGAIFANVWQETNILRIEARTGIVDAVIDAAPLVTRMKRPGGVLNGIAYSPERGTFFLTGKHWTKVFEVLFQSR